MPDTTVKIEGARFIITMDPERRIIVDPRGMREAYLEEMAALIDGMRRGCAEADVGYMTASTDMPPARVLLRFLAGRG